jgi:hypothetical protein
MGRDTTIRWKDLSLEAGVTRGTPTGISSFDSGDANMAPKVGPSVGVGADVYETSTALGALNVSLQLRGSLLRGEFEVHQPDWGADYKGSTSRLDLDTTAAVSTELWPRSPVRLSASAGVRYERAAEDVHEAFSPGLWSFSSRGEAREYLDRAGLVVGAGVEARLSTRFRLAAGVDLGTTTAVGPRTAEDTYAGVSQTDGSRWGFTSNYDRFGHFNETDRERRTELSPYLRLSASL